MHAPVFEQLGRDGRKCRGRSIGGDEPNRGRGLRAGSPAATKVTKPGAGTPLSKFALKDEVRSAG
jgi:hypothetical protein